MISNVRGETVQRIFKEISFSVLLTHVVWRVAGCLQGVVQRGLFGEAKVCELEHTIGLLTCVEQVLWLWKHGST